MNNLNNGKKITDINLFKGALRQKLKCLQASLSNRLKLVSDSESLTKLKDQNPEKEFLSISYNKKTQEGEIKEIYLVTSITQATEGNVFQHLKNKNLFIEDDISCHINPEHLLAADKFNILLKKLAQEPENFDFKTCERWGSKSFSIDFSSIKKTCEWVKNWYSKFDVVALSLQNKTEQFLNNCDSIFESITSATLSSDGANVTFILEGKLTCKDDTDLNKMKNRLINSALNVIAINNISKNHSQISFSHPIKECALSNINDELQCFIYISNNKLKNESQNSTKKVC